MKKFFNCLFLIFFLFLSSVNLYAEDKPAARTFPKLPETVNDPILTNAHVYPFWGPVCQRYTYSVIYQDKENRAPEYVRIYFNGEFFDIDKENPNDNDYQKGVKYVYQYVPKKLSSNFYFFEGSNGLGKARDGIIDSPDNGPVLFESSFAQNEITLINAQTGEKVWTYPVNKEWVGGVALSSDGKYLAAQTSSSIYFFETDSNKPKWIYSPDTKSPIGGDVKGGVAISGNGKKVFAALGQKALLFENNSNDPIWESTITANAYNAAISTDGNFAAVGTAGEEQNPNTNLLIVWNTSNSKPLWQYHSSGNFHDVSFSNDGSFIAASTGCPDRRAYLFAKDSNTPIWQSEMLTRDSPVHQAKISSDGATLAFGAEADNGAVHVFSKNSGAAIWKFPDPKDKSFRALGITPSGKFIAGATMGGDVFLFNKNSAVPIASFNINASLGAIDIASDGSFVAVGGTDNKVHIFAQASGQEKANVSLNEHVGEIDISADNRFIAAGTSGSVYFFESLVRNEEKVFECQETIEPTPESELIGNSDSEGHPKKTYCGDGVCEGPETFANCAQDCDDSSSKQVSTVKKEVPKEKLLLIIFAVLFAAVLLGLGGYLVITKFFRKKQHKETPKDDSLGGL